MKYTTLRRLQESGMSQCNFKELLKHLGKTAADDEPLPLRTVLEINGLEDAILALPAIDPCPEVRLYGIRCVREIQHLLRDPRSLDALDVAELHAVGRASDAELDAAWAAAWGAVYDVKLAAELDAVLAVTRVTARHPVGDIAWAALVAAWDAAHVAAVDAGDNAWDAAWAAARDAQREDFIAIFCTEEQA